MPDYKYGTYGEIVDSKSSLSFDLSTIPVYFGTAPVNLVPGYKEQGVVNKPVRIKSLAEAQKLMGYFPSFEEFTLNEPLAAHFDNGGDSVGPIYVINVLDPETHKGGTGETAQLVFSNGKALIQGQHTIVDTIAIKRPFDHYRKNGFIKNTTDAETVFKAYGKDATGKIKNDQIFYWAFEKTIDKKIDIIIEIEAKGKKYGCLDIGKNRGTGVTIAYMSLKAGDHDFVDGAASKETLDLSDYTGDVTMTLYECKATDTSTYPTDLKPVESITMHFDAGDSPQYYEVGTDYELSYNATRGGIVIQAVSDDMGTELTATYDTVDPKLVTAEDIIGEVSYDGKLSGIQALKLLFMDNGVIPNLLAAPGWSHIPDVCAALASASRKINGHWDAMYIVDIPLEDDDGQPVDTMEAAIKWKRDHGFIGSGLKIAQPYNDERSKVCWPMGLDGKGRPVHISTLCVVEFCRIDKENGDVPFETCANKAVPVIKQYFGEKSKNNGFDQVEAATLTQKGITTIMPWASSWRIWGDHTAAYDYDAYEIDPRTIFDVSMRMLMHITNSFQRQWALEIDSPMTRGLLDTILNTEQEKLDRLVSMGALLGEPKVIFSEDDNPLDNLINGQFTWSIDVTPTPPLKSATVYVAYTDEGFSVYWGEE